jgi:hypothetical protein
MQALMSTRISSCELQKGPNRYLEDLTEKVNHLANSLKWRKLIFTQQWHDEEHFIGLSWYLQDIEYRYTMILGIGRHGLRRKIPSHLELVVIL